MATAYRDSATRPSPQKTLGEKKGGKIFCEKNGGKIFCEQKLGVKFFWNLTTNDLAENLK